MTITHNRELHAFFNMPKKGSSEVRNKPDLVRDEFEETVEMSTYLVAFVVCDFSTIDKVTNIGHSYHSSMHSTIDYSVITTTFGRFLDE